VTRKSRKERLPKLRQGSSNASKGCGILNFRLQQSWRYSSWIQLGRHDRVAIIQIAVGVRTQHRL